MSSGPPSAPSVASSTPYYASTFRRNKTSKSSSPVRHHLNPFSASASELASQQTTLENTLNNYSQQKFPNTVGNGDEIVALAAESGDYIDQRIMSKAASTSELEMGVGQIPQQRVHAMTTFEAEDSSVPYQALGEYDVRVCYCLMTTNLKKGLY